MYLVSKFINMKTHIYMLLLLYAIFGLPEEVFTQKILNCYWGTWAHYRRGVGRFEPADVNPNLCTHISYAFFGITASSELRVLDGYLDLPSGLNFIKKAIALKNINPNLKVLAAIGGWNEGSVNYSNMARDASRRSTFIESVVAFLAQYGFDGISLDWEYPAQRGGLPEDKQNFVQLLNEIKQAFSQYGWQLFIATAAAKPSAMLSYDIPEISKYVDYIDVMTYDFAGVWDRVTGIHAQLNGQGQNNIVASVNYWLSAGAPPNKLVLGLAFYGRTFQLANSQQTMPGSPITGAGMPGPYTQESGFWAYYEICQKIAEGGWQEEWDNTAAAPYAFKGNQWVGYDNIDSINLRSDYINSMGLAGAFIWSLEVDDFRNTCGDGRYPLLAAISNKILNSNSSIGTTSTTVSPMTSTSIGPTSTNGQPSTPAGITSTTASTSSPTSTSTQSPNNSQPSTPAGITSTTASSSSSTSTSTQSPNNSTCGIDGFYRNESDCSKFYRCVAGKRYDFQCSNGLLFDQSLSACNWSALVICD